MSHEQSMGTLSRLSASPLGVFRGRSAVALGLSRKQLGALAAAGVIECLYVDTYRMTVVPQSNAQLLRAALLWAGDGAVAADLSAGETYGLEGVRASRPEILVPRCQRLRAEGVTVHRSDYRAGSWCGAGTASR